MTGVILSFEDAILNKKPNDISYDETQWVDDQQSKSIHVKVDLSLRTFAKVAHDNFTGATTAVKTCSVLEHIGDDHLFEWRWIYVKKSEWYYETGLYFSAALLEMKIS